MPEKAYSLMYLRSSNNKARQRHFRNAARFIDSARYVLGSTVNDSRAAKQILSIPLHWLNYCQLHVGRLVHYTRTSQAVQPVSSKTHFL
jgi:hypothetical protein